MQAMAEATDGIGPAVKEALEWLQATPETGGALLGINGRTLAAMCQGIVPMRSLMIRFATQLGSHCEVKPGAPAWWRDVDAWLRLAGYEPRRDSPTSDGSSNAQVNRPARPSPPVPQANRPHPQAFRPPSPGAPRAAPEIVSEGADAVVQALAGEAYRPTYERHTFNERQVHVFHILDTQDQRAFEMSFPLEVDYKARAAQIKRDLATLTRPQFERKYDRYRTQL